MSEIRLIQGPEMREELRERAELDVYRYDLNMPSFVISLIVGVAILGLDIMLWWQSGLADISWIVTFVVLAILGLSALGLAGYWYVFVQTNFLALSPETFLIGQRDRMWSIDWELLDAEALGFDDMTAQSTKSELDMQVAGQDIHVHLFNAFVHLEELPELIFQLLQHLKEHEDNHETENDEQAESGPG